MSKIKRWLYNKFLPSWCREGLLEYNARLTAKVEEQQIEIGKLHAYISGLENAMRAQRRITIRNGVKP